MKINKINEKYIFNYFIYEYYVKLFMNTMLFYL